MSRERGDFGRGEVGGSGLFAGGRRGVRWRGSGAMRRVAGEVLAALFTLAGSESVREVRVEGDVVYMKPERGTQFVRGRSGGCSRIRRGWRRKRGSLQEGRSGQWMRCMRAWCRRWRRLALSGNAVVAGASGFGYAGAGECCVGE